MVKIFDFNLLEFVDSTNDTLISIKKSIKEKYKFDMILDIDKLNFFLQKNIKDLDTLINSCAYKIPGTDGVRSIAITKSENDNFLKSFLKNKELTPNFVKHYTSAFLKMIPEDTSEIAIGEDGRELLNNNNIKVAVKEALIEANITTIDLQIIPTPLLVAYSLEKRIPAIMITASHNPPEYNGIKLFIDGKKLYPFSKLGEYQLTYNFFTTKEKQIKNFDNQISKTCFPLSIFDKIFSGINFELVKKTLNNTPLYLDLANGAFSKIAQKYLGNQGIRTVSLACDLGLKNINKNSGVALLEDLPFSVNESQIPTIKRLLENGKKFEKNLYALVCDGDGDRAFILKYNNKTQNVTVFNGDILGYIIAKNLHNPARKGLFCLTIESDFALSSIIRDQLGWSTRVVGVGDRWLVNSISDDCMFVGCERSGHVIVKNESFNPPLLSGNGLLTGLLALQFNIESYEVGYNKKITSFNFPLEDFYNGSSTWEKINNKILDFKQFNFEAFKIEYEYNVLSFKITDKDNKEIGLIYVRKSGTEPKISISISTLKKYEDTADSLINTLKKEINYSDM